MPVLADALDVQEARIVTQDDANSEPKTYAYVTGVTIDNRRPEEFVNVMGGQVRRRKPEETDYSVDGAVLYNKLVDLHYLKEKKFDIEIMMIDPMTKPENNPSSTQERGQKIVIKGCRIADQSINITDNSTVRFSGRADYYTVSPIGDSQEQSELV
jgi:hypothetical protein